MSYSKYPRAYGTAALTFAFAAGILVTLVWKHVSCTDLEARFRRRRAGRRTSTTSRPRASLLFEPVSLQDHESGPAKCTDIVDGVEGCIGNTPLLRIRSLSDATRCTILAKAEFLNGAGGSPKDRVALNMIRVAEAQGLLTPGRGDTIYEGTVGSTGISLAMLARARGYRAHICMPDDQSAEKTEMLHHLGAVVERVPVAPITSPEHYVNLARRRAAEHTASSSVSNGFFADQFESSANYAAHMQTTGPELWYQTGGRMDAFVAGAGTGGTLSGVARHLKEERGMSSLRVVLADPHGSGLYHRVRDGVMYAGATEREGTRRRTQVDSIVEGIGVNRVTANFEAGRELVDDAVRVTDEQACRMACWLVEHDGIFTGSSSAVNCVAAVITALALPPGSRVVTVLCDSGTRHLSKFYKHVADLGLEDAPHDSQHFLTALGLEKHQAALDRRIE